MESDTPNVHTPPQEHAPPEPHDHPHPGEDMEEALNAHEHESHPHRKHEGSHEPHPPHDEPPMVILDRRFASGEITKEEYRESKELLHKK